MCAVLCGARSQSQLAAEQLKMVLLSSRTPYLQATLRSDSWVRCTLVERSVRGSSVGVLSRWSDNQSFHTGDLWGI